MITSFVLVRFQKHFHANGNLHYLYLFAVLFSDTLRNSDYTESNELLMTNNVKEYQSKWSQSNIGYNRCLPGRFDENHKKRTSIKTVLASNWAPLENKSECFLLH